MRVVRATEGFDRPSGNCLAREFQLLVPHFINRRVAHLCVPGRIERKRGRGATRGVNRFDDLRGSIPGRVAKIPHRIFVVQVRDVRMRRRVDGDGAVSSDVVFCVHRLDCP